MQSKLLLALLASCVVAGTVGAQSAEPASSTPTAAAANASSSTAAPDQTKGHFSRLDKDQDGSISREEAGGHKRFAQHFDAMDSDKNGKLSTAEMAAQRDAMRAKAQSRFDQHFKAADTNGDGALSKEEAQAAKMPGVAEHFGRADTDKDGKLSRQEMQSAHASMHSRHHMRRGHDARPHHADHFKAADFNGDGVVSKAEALSHASETFDKLDADKDGKLTAAEVHAAHTGARGEHPRHDAHRSKHMQQFKAADQNRDGALSKGEAQAGELDHIAQNFDAIDTNKDGKATHEELRGAMKKRK